MTALATVVTPAQARLLLAPVTTLRSAGVPLLTEALQTLMAEYQAFAAGPRPWRRGQLLRVLLDHWGFVNEAKEVHTATQSPTLTEFDTHETLQLQLLLVDCGKVADANAVAGRRLQCLLLRGAGAP